MLHEPVPVVERGRTGIALEIDYGCRGRRTGRQVERVRAGARQGGQGRGRLGVALLLGPTVDVHSGRCSGCCCGGGRRRRILSVRVRVRARAQPVQGGPRVVSPSLSVQRVDEVKIGTGSVQC